MILESNDQNKFGISRLVKDGKAKRIAKGFFIKLPTDDEAGEIKKKLPEIISRLVGESRPAFRSALVPLGDEQDIILFGGVSGEISIGEHFTLRIIKNKEGDGFSGALTVFDNFKKIGMVQAVLENLKRGRYGEKYGNRDLAVSMIKKSVYERNGDLLRCEGMIGEFKRVGEGLGWDDEVKTALEIIHDASKAFLREHGKGVDYRRIELFRALADAVEKDTNLSLLSEKMILKNDPSESERKNESFFESYFSNYIEGTRFHEDEAIDIVFNSASYKRHEDGHDLLSLYKLSYAHALVPPVLDFSDPEKMIKNIQDWHAFFLDHSKEKHPGEFKDRRNSAGDTDFVDPDKVERMLAEAFFMADSISDPLKRAIFIAIASVEIHPFLDGNGRITRLLLNDVLSSSKRGRIIFPTVFRADYLRNLKAFSAQGSCTGIIKFFAGLIQANLEINYDQKISDVVLDLKEKNAFSESETGKWGIADKSGADHSDSNVFDVFASIQENDAVDSIGRRR